MEIDKSNRMYWLIYLCQSKKGHNLYPHGQKHLTSMPTNIGKSSIDDDDRAKETSFDDAKNFATSMAPKSRQSSSAKYTDAWRAHEAAVGFRQPPDGLDSERRKGDP